ncbi:hypothetical protein DPMN_018439 [Dreissena polymorpha]|uniref:Uncharacterized protein n=1 Tax=Dreissena polymorpha TaxID=45954 RepID=A0A9D4NJC5_DREPO|nr:hypothetical protein DPMN_018439 [Dreissena polymorpha]
MKFHQSAIYQLVRDINKTNVQNLTSRVFTRRPSKNVTSRVFTSFFNLFTRKIAPPTGGHTNILTNFNLNRGIIGTNLLTKFHEEQTRNVASRVFTSTVPPTGGHVFQQTRTTFKLNQPIIKTNILTNFELDQEFIGTKLLTKFHEDQTRNVASRMFTNKCRWTDGQTTEKDQ